jgi:hypothetical protein
MVGASFTVAAAAEVLRSKKSVIAYANAQISTAQSKFGGSSAYFDGLQDRLQVGTTDGIFFTGDFTIEFWFRPGNESAMLFGNVATNASPNAGQVICYYASSTGGFQVYFNGQSALVENTTMAINNWHHFALVRSGSTVRAYVNGTQQTSTKTVTGDIGTATYPTWYLAGLTNDADCMLGYMDEVRFSNSARYTAGFTPSTTPFVNDANTLFLMHANGTNASTFFEDDNGVRASRSLIANGNAQVDTAQSKFGGSALLCDGTGDYMMSPQGTQWDFGTSSFTIEYWIRFNVAPTLYVPIALRPSASINNGEWWCEITNAEKKMYWGFKNFAGTQYYVNLGLSGNAFTTGQWYHIALVNNAGTARMYVDGTATGTSTALSGSFGISTSDLWVGAGAGSYSLNGWMDEVRISNTARYTAGFTPSTTPFVNDSNTLLLMHMDGTDAATVFRDDNGARAQAGITAVGNAQVSTAQSKFGGASALFDGFTDYLSVKSLPSADLTGNFTIEAFVRFDILPSNQTLDGGSYMMLFSRGPGATQSESYVFINNTTIELALPGGGGKYGNWSIPTVSINTWYHIAIVRNSGTIKVYWDGTERTSFTNAYNWGAVTGTEDIITSDHIWGQFIDGRGSWDGYMDEIRISKSARYTANFTPSTTPFQSDANTLLLLHMDGTNASTAFFDDNGIAPYTP